MRRLSLWFFVLVLVLFAFASSASAASGTGGVSLSVGVTPIAASDAGSGNGAPKYDDVYQVGWTGRIEPYYDFHPLVRGQFGVGYNSWSGKTFRSSNPTLSVEFDDLKTLTYYVGVKVRFLPNSNIRPYAVADFGVATIYSVDVRINGGPKVPYWQNTNTVFFDIGGGGEFKVSDTVSFFMDARMQGTGKPTSASALSSEAEGVISFPVSAGINITF